MVKRSVTGVASLHVVDGIDTPPPPPHTYRGVNLPVRQLLQGRKW